MTEISGLLRAMESNVAYVTDEESYYLRIFYLRIPNYFMLQYLEAWRKFLVLKGGRREDWDVFFFLNLERYP